MPELSPYPRCCSACDASRGKRLPLRGDSLWDGPGWAASMVEGQPSTPHGGKGAECRAHGCRVVAQALASRQSVRDVSPSLTDTNKGHSTSRGVNCYAEYRFASRPRLTTADAFGADDLMQ